MQYASENGRELAHGINICAMNLVYICDCKAFWSTYDTVICEIKAISNSHTFIKN